jgi:murein L,D-transpeptidase YcbB/YkuD
MRAALALSIVAASTLLCGLLAACDRPPVVSPSTTPPPDAIPPAGYAGVLARNGIAAPERGKFILVNIPAFELVALEDGNAVLRSRVIVGRPATPTPELTSAMHAVTFNPSWTPTPSMVRHEGLRRMPPGPNNPLGQILFELDNDELIFLHDTNDRSLFDRPQRALSHGCIRVQQARALAAWALGTSETEVAAMVGQGSHSVPLATAIPVLLAYHTRFPDETGRIATYPDIYGRDRTAQRPSGESAESSPGDCRLPARRAAGVRLTQII